MTRCGCSCYRRGKQVKRTRVTFLLKKKSNQKKTNQKKTNQKKTNQKKTNQKKTKQGYGLKMSHTLKFYLKIVWTGVLDCPKNRQKKIGHIILDFFL